MPTVTLTKRAYLNGDQVSTSSTKKNTSNYKLTFTIEYNYLSNSYPSNKYSLNSIDVHHLWGGDSISYPGRTGSEPYTVNDIYQNCTFYIDYHFYNIDTCTIKCGTGVSLFKAKSAIDTKSVTTLNQTLTVDFERGFNITFSGTADAGYVFSTGAFTSSKTEYNGNGTSSFSKTISVSNNTTFTLKAVQYKITPKILENADWGTPTINGSSTSVALTPNTTYTLGFISSKADTIAPDVNYWSINGEKYTSSFTTGSSITGNIDAILYLKQTKWLVEVDLAPSYEYGTIYINGEKTNLAYHEQYKPFTVSCLINSSFSYLGLVPDKLVDNFTDDEFPYNGIDDNTILYEVIDGSDGRDLDLTYYLKPTKFKMSFAYGTTGTESWGTFSASKEYVGTGDSVTLTFTPTNDLISINHPIVEYWETLGSSSPKPTTNADGSSSITVTLGEVTKDFVVTCYLIPGYRYVSIARIDTFETEWGNFYLDESGTTTDKYYAPGSTITIWFVRDTAYDTKERPQVNTIEIGDTEALISGKDNVYSYTYTLPEDVKTDLEISCSLKQTAWPITVKSGTGGAVTAKRLSEDKETLESVMAEAEDSQDIYLCTWQYLAISSTPNDHYKFSSWESYNLIEIAEGQYQLTSAKASSIVGAFERSDFLVSCVADEVDYVDIYLNAQGTTSKYYLKTIDSDPIVICKIKSAYAGNYKVESWSIGSESGIGEYNVSGDFYYCEVTGRSDVVVTAHIVRTTFELTLNCEPNNAYATFGSLIALVGGVQATKFSVNGEYQYKATIKETTAIEVDFYQKYGGRVSSWTPSAEIVNPSIGDNSYSFAMPSADCSLTITLGAKETYNVTVCVKNSSEGHEQNIPAILKVTSRTYSTVVVGETDESGVAKTFAVYKGEEYTISVAEEFYSRKYKILGWKDENDAWIDGADGNSISFSNDGTTNLTRTLVYGLRETGTVTIEYAKRANGVITTLDACPEDCSFTIENTEDKTDDTHWLVGADIKMPYTINGTTFSENDDAYMWLPIEVDIAFDNDEYSTNASWDNGLLTQDGEFVMRGNVRVRVVFSYSMVPGYTSMCVGYKANSNKEMGSVSFFATEMDAYTENTTGAKALIQKMKKCVIMASPRPGYAFAGWWLLNDAGEYEAVENAAAVYEIDGANVTSPMPTYYAEFFSSLISNVKEWNGNKSAAKTFVWQSKVYVGAQFFQMQSVRIYSDAYPVKLTVLGASSPEDIFGDTASKQTITITSQEPRRLPRMHTEKYFAFSVSGTARINHVGISSSMIGLTS